MLPAKLFFGKKSKQKHFHWTPLLHSKFWCFVRQSFAIIDKAIAFDWLTWRMGGGEEEMLLAEKLFSRVGIIGGTVRYFVQRGNIGDGSRE
jgi:hypothetical protein